MTCDYTDRDGAYVLGALSSAERREFEEHLAGCDTCARSVREIAGIPGLLAGVQPDVLEPTSQEPPLPASLLPALLADVRRTRRRRGMATLGLAAAAAVALFVPVAVTVAHQNNDAPSSVASAQGQTMAPVGAVPVRARLAFEQVAWGTRLNLTCTYARHDRYRLPQSVTYGLYVTTRTGRTERVGTWRALDGKTMRVTAATATDRRDISAVEVRTADGRPVLQLKG